MAPAPAYAFDDALAAQVRALIDMVCDDPDQTEAELGAQREATAAVIGALDPRDAIEAIISGHCVMYHYLTRDAARDFSRCVDRAVRPRLRSAIMAAERGFSRNLRLLWRKQNGTGAAAANAAAMKALVHGLTPAGAAPRPGVSAAASASAPARPAPAAPSPGQSASQPAAKVPTQMFPVSAQSAILASAAPRRKPRFVCERVQIPNSQKPSRTPQFGAAWRLPDAPKPIWEMAPPRRSVRARLLGSTTAGGMGADAMPVATGLDWIGERMSGKALAAEPASPRRGKRPVIERPRRAKSVIF